MKNKIYRLLLDTEKYILASYQSGAIEWCDDVLGRAWSDNIDQFEKILIADKDYFKRCEVAADRYKNRCIELISEYKNRESKAQLDMFLSSLEKKQ